MESNNIGVDVRAKMVKKSGGAFPFLFASPLETAQSFKEAIIEYSVDKLIDIAENKVIQKKNKKNFIKITYFVFLVNMES